MSLRWRAAALGAAAALVLIAPSLPAADAGAVRLSWVSAGAPAASAVELTGLGADVLGRLGGDQIPAEQWHPVLAVYVLPESGTLLPAQPPMLGTYRIDGTTVRFSPRFPLSTGARYLAVTRHGAGATAEFRVPLPAGARATTVAAVYPESDALPENLLKFYLHFSGPMNGGAVYDHIHLRDAAGKEIEYPFLRLGQELWDPAMTRLTLLMDPGRVKRGLVLRSELGPAIEAGKTYTLTIDAAWKDANGQPLASSFTKRFRVIEADRAAIDVGRWQVKAPPAGSRTALEIAFPESLDHALAQRLIRVVDPSGNTVSGDVTTADLDRRWLLQPDAAWKPGRHQVVAVTTIEDLAGNNVGKQFDVDVFEKVERSLSSETVSIPVEIR